MLANARQVAHQRPRRATSTPTRSRTSSWLASLKAAFIARGADAVTATQRAYAAAFGMVQQQAAMLSFIDGFRLLGMLFLAVRRRSSC